MAISNDKLVKLIGKPAADALANAGYSVTGEREEAAWQTMAQKYEFVLSALETMAKKPLRADPDVDASELRHLVEQSLKMVAIAPPATPFDDLRFQLQLERDRSAELVEVLESISKTSKDSKLTSKIRSVLKQ